MKHFGSLSFCLCITALDFTRASLVTRDMSFALLFLQGETLLVEKRSELESEVSSERSSQLNIEMKS